MFLLNESGVIKINKQKKLILQENPEVQLTICFINTINCDDPNIKIIKSNIRGSSQEISMHLNTLNLFDEDESYLILKNVIKNIYFTKYLDLEEKLNIFSDLVALLDNTFDALPSEIILSLFKTMDENEINNIIKNEDYFKKYIQIGSKSYLKESVKTLKNFETKSKSIYFENAIIKHIKNNLQNFKEPHIYEYMIELYIRDPEAATRPQSWFEYAKIMEKRFREIGMEGSEYHLYAVSILINQSEVTDPQLKNNFMNYFQQLTKKYKTINFKTNLIRETQLKIFASQGKHDEMIDFYIKFLNFLKTERKSLDASLDRDNENAKFLNEIAMCENSLHLSQMYVLKGNLDKSIAYMTDYCQPFLSNIYDKAKTLSGSYFFQLYFLKYIKQGSLGFILKEDKNKLISILNTKEVSISDKFKIAIILSLNGEEFYDDYNELLIRELTEFREKDNSLNNRYQRLSLLMVINNFFDYFVDMNIYKSKEEFNKIYNKIISTLLNQLLYNAKADAFDNNFRSYQTPLNSNNPIVKKIGLLTVVLKNLKIKLIIHF